MVADPILVAVIMLTQSSDIYYAAARKVLFYTDWDLRSEYFLLPKFVNRKSEFVVAVEVERRHVHVQFVEPRGFATLAVIDLHGLTKQGHV